MTTRVPPDLPRKQPCPIAFVAEAPGEAEVDQGRPLVGPSGRLFNALLAIARIDRRDCLVTNVFDEQAPKNEVRAWCAGRKERDGWEGYDLPPLDRGQWLTPERTGALMRLQRELLDADPNLIVALGATALWALTGETALEPRRGVVGEATRLTPGRKMLATYHPAFLFHSYQMFPVVAMDFARAATECLTREVLTTERELWLEPTIGDLHEFAEKHLRDATVLSIDIETIPKWRQITCISFAPSPHVALVVPFVDWRKPDRSYWGSLEEEFEAWKWVREVCASPVAKLGQNFTYDFQWLYDMGIGVVNYREDTRLLHHALEPELPKSLQFLGSCYARERAFKSLPTQAWKRDE